MQKSIWGSRLKKILLGAWVCSICFVIPLKNSSGEEPWKALENNQNSGNSDYTEDPFAEIEGIDIVVAGVIKSDVTAKVMANRSPFTLLDIFFPKPPLCGYLKDPHAVIKTQTVNAILGTTFGIAYRVKGTPDGSRVHLHAKILHPPLNKPGRKKYVSDMINLSAQINKEDTVGWIFQDDWELVQGKWIFELYYKDKKMAEQSFTVERVQGQGPSDAWTKRLQEFDEAIAKNPADYGSYNGRGNAYLDLGDLDKAIDDYTKSIELNPAFPSPYNGRSKAFLDKGDIERSLSDCQKALEINPHYAFALINCGNAYERQRNYPQAIASYSRAIELAPDYADSYYNRAIAFAHQGDENKAIADYTRAITLNPHHAQAYTNRALLYRKQGKRKEAQSDFFKATGN